MDPRKLLTLADLVGLSQADIARALGITPVQVCRWGRARPMPDKYLEPLWQLIQEAAQRYLATVKPIAVPGQRGLTAISLDPRAEAILQGLHALGWEYEVMRGNGPATWIASVHLALETLPEEARELRKPANTARLRELGLQLVEYARILDAIGPIQTLLEDIDDANNSEQSSDPGPVCGATPGD